jgi:hypothetical protein
VEVRCALLNELGDGLLDRHDGSALRMISKANGSADALVGIILDTFPGFRDYVDLDAPPGVAPFPRGWEAARGAAPTSVVHFHKRSPICGRRWATAAVAEASAAARRPNPVAAAAAAASLRTDRRRGCASSPTLAS